MSNILITGVAGFIGSHLSEYLSNKYPALNFIGIDKLSYCSNLKNISNVGSNFKFIQADICELDFMRFLLTEYQIDIIIHFAAYSHVDHSFGNSLEFTKNNIVGTHSLLEAARAYNDIYRQSDLKGIKKFIHVSTDEVYGSVDDISSENSILDPTNPYSASKAAAEHLVRSYYHSFKLPIIITRGNNVYGPKQFPEKVIPRFCLNLLNDQKCAIQGTGQQSRSFMYIDDVVKAFECVLFKGKIGEIYNIGIDKEYSINQLSQMIIKKLKNDNGNWIEYVKDRDFNDIRYNINFDKLIELGWSPEITFEEGLDLTIEWYKNHLNYWE